MESRSTPESHYTRYDLDSHHRWGPDCLSSDLQNHFPKPLNTLEFPAADQKVSVSFHNNNYEEKSKEYCHGDAHGEGEW